MSILLHHSERILLPSSVPQEYFFCSKKKKINFQRHEKEKEKTVVTCQQYIKLYFAILSSLVALSYANLFINNANTNVPYRGLLADRVGDRVATCPVLIRTIRNLNDVPGFPSASDPDTRGADGGYHRASCRGPKYTRGPGQHGDWSGGAGDNYREDKLGEGEKRQVAIGAVFFL